MIKSIELITNPTLRAEHINRIDLLSQVGELKRLPEARYSTTKQVAEFYGVSNKIINNAVAFNRHEIFNAGVKQYKYENIKNAFCEKSIVEEDNWNDFRNEYGIAYNITNLFPKKAVLLIGFILEKSPVADKLRELAVRQADLFEPNEVPTVTAPTVVEPKVEPVVIQSVQKKHNDMQVTTIENNVHEPLVIDSREVAKMMGKEHKVLMRDIRTYVGYLKDNEQSTDLHPANFFIESSYKNENNQSYPCYLLTKKGCDMVANKMTGAKGVLFTATYVTRFEEMENELKNKAVAPVASYMISDPIERAKLWIKEEEQRMLLAETVETQVKVIEEKDEIIEKQAKVIDEQEQQIMKANAIMYEQQEIIAESINEKYARAYEMSRGYSPKEMRGQIAHMIKVNFPNSSGDGWSKLYNAYNLKYNVNVMNMKKDYEKNNHVKINIIDFVEQDTIMISQLYDLALKIFDNKGSFEKYYS